MSQLDSTLAVPMKLDAFILNEKVCTDNSDAKTLAKIAPITQPNYTFLRLKHNILQNDIQPHTDLHNTTPVELNSRATDLSTGDPRKNRMGVYVHWMIPPVYRSGTAATKSGTKDHDKEGLQKPISEDVDNNAAQFRPIPTRWLVIRRLHLDTAKPAGKIPEYQAWVIESDRKFVIDNIERSVDLEVDVTPFVHAEVGQSIDHQAEVFIGKKSPADKWNETKADRVPLSVLGSGNMLFADFQCHNSNVLSLVDNFEYESGDCLQEATADYYVIGWHASANEDPFFISGASLNRSVRFEFLDMVFKSNNPDHQTWWNRTDSGLTICHGAIYGVEWNWQKKPNLVEADECSKDLNNLMPVAVGSTPLDALLAYVHAHQDGGDDTIHHVMKSIIQIQQYLINQDDTVDGQQIASDLMYNYNYDAFDGGTQFHLAGDEDRPKDYSPPSTQALSNLALLNQEQLRLDALQRALRRKQWDLFSLWWKCVWEDAEDKDYKQLMGIYKKKVQILYQGEIKNLSEEIDSSRQEIQKLKADPTLTKAQPGAMPSFYRQRDPTLLVGNISSGWPTDWREAQQVRVNTDITTWKAATDYSRDIDCGIKNLPADIQNVARALVQEFISLSPKASSNVESRSLETTCPPQYHDTDPKSPGVLRDQWNSTQPWFPLFLEWEVEYSHIAYDYWSLEQRSGKLQYGIQAGKDVSKDFAGKTEIDRRRVSGRNLILPHPNFSLRSKIEQLFQLLPEKEQDKILNKAARQELFDNLEKLKFLSAPLAGLHDHLATLAHGSHIKPTLRLAGEKLKGIASAFKEDAGFIDEVLEAMGTETDLTPYAQLVNFYDFPAAAFKPAVHGQFKFTKINIIDKFGQAIHAIDPRWLPGGPPPLYPCISDFYAPQSKSDNPKVANTVETQPDGKNEFIQMWPHINQPARVNSAFVKRDTDMKSWIPLTEWENPIWGWLVINYAEYGIQIFLQDGTFYREVRLGGQTAASTSDKWLPFDKPSQGQPVTQLDYLIEKLGKPDYLQSFVNMINESLQTSQLVPDAYSQFQSSVVGRPLALTTVAWSLELADDEYVNQSTKNETAPERFLLPKQTGINTERPLYTFKFQMGDKDRAYDGLVGYFNVTENTEKGNDFKLDDCFTYFGVDKKYGLSDTAPLRKIEAANYPSFQAFYTDPNKDATSIQRERNQQLGRNVYGAIMDPFTAVHAYSGILPSKAVKLPPWTWQTALSRMTAFFHAGPLVITKDVPNFDESHTLHADYNLEKVDIVRPSPVAVPGMDAKDWTWLQPYSHPVKKDEPAEETSFMPLGLIDSDQRPRFEDPPYTAIEGYLQLRKPILKK
ncbi:hypothetical protein BGW36DRAFT_458996 [Talaromyces proteolyticus]|uniref:Uncharacterized protein n=1 Tax=Talaromyces proteolyticus TaxID=1131652 RepID=A0AAD4L2Z3_9EURO|nr:uncharacterized protein BGW36DRAFT_458996 [Talaromyces proteolyticus]KAH8702269.1 hypothetical protein BGW36DRAFT_458996 [Talaromyces proteolyticus]